MTGCLLAQHLARRVDRLEVENAELRELLLLLANAAGIDVVGMLRAERVARRGGYPATFEEFEAFDRYGGDAA